MRYAPPGMCLNDFAIIGDGPYHLLHLQGPWTQDFDAVRMETSYGRAHSVDLVTWEPLAAAFGVGMPGQFDDSAVWTMHPFPHGNGMAMAYTGVRDNGYPEQAVGMAFSEHTDGTGWRRAGFAPVRPDERWYRRGPHEAWRDPWVVRRPTAGIEYAVLTSARTATDPVDRAGCVGWAVSADLERWSVMPPLLVPGVDELECPVLEPHPDGGWLLLGSIAPARQIYAWRAAAFDGVWQALGPIAPPGPYAPRIVRGQAGETLLLHTVPRRVGLRDDGAPCRGMLGQPKLLDATDDEVRLRWWDGLSDYIGAPTDPGQPVRDAVIQATVDGHGSVLIRDDGQDNAIEVIADGAMVSIRTRSGRVLQEAVADNAPKSLRIAAIGEYVEVYADDVLCLSVTSYASGNGACRPSSPRMDIRVHPLRVPNGGRDDVSTLWSGPTPATTS